MKKLTLIVSALAIVLGLAQCTKRPNMPLMYNGHTQEITFTTAGGDGAKGGFEEVTEDLQHVLKYKWENTDVLHVYAQNGGENFIEGTCLGTLSVRRIFNEGFDAEFAGVLDNVPDEGWLRFVHYGKGVDVDKIDESGVAVDFSEQDGLLTTISNKVVAVCDQRTNPDYRFEGCQLLVQFAVAKVDLSQFVGDVDVSCILSKGIAVSKEGSIEEISGVHSTLKGISDSYYVVLMPLDNTKPIKFCDKVKIGTLQGEISKNAYFSNNHDAIVIDADYLTEGSVTGECFTVGPRESVHFSNGTLQWTADGEHTVADGTKAGVWRLAENQWDCILVDNSYLGANGYYMDLFGFGTSGYDQAPNKHDGFSADYGNGQNDIAGTNYDWGVYNAISNAGNQPGLWRTPTNDEWVYLATGRNDSKIYDSENKFMAGVGDLTLSDGTTVKGLFILPDKYYTASGHKEFTQDYDWALTEKELSDYSIVFSPAGGYRGADNVVPDPVSGYNYVLIYDYTDYKGYFHSSSAREGDDGWNYEQAYIYSPTVEWETQHIYFGLDDDRRGLGFFVRLVTK